MKNVTLAALALASLSSFTHAQNPQSYCTAGLSTNLCAAQISANRQPDTSNTSGCVITVSGVPGLQQGLVFYGIDNGGFTPSLWGGSQGGSYLCVKAPLQRMGGTQSSGGTPGACDGTYVFDWDAFQNAHPTALGNPWTLGEKAFAQAWYRDVTAPLASNLSNAVVLELRNPEPVPCVTTLPGLAVIPAGTFLMGSNAPSGPPYNGQWGDASPAHQVTLTYCFWMGVTEVTQAQYTALMGSNPSHFIGADRPVEQLNLASALAYCAALNAQQSALGNVPQGYQYRLPTEAEWEYACRAGTTTEFNVGADLFCGQAKFQYSLHSDSACVPFNSPTEPVASYAPNAWGLYDMHGNVWEWCLDDVAPYPAGPVTDPVVFGSGRAARGGAANADSSFCRSAYRDRNSPLSQLSYLGFRVVLAPILVP